MISLSAIAERRAAEQVAKARFGADGYAEEVKRARVSLPFKVGSRKVSCICGDCKKCRKRAGMRSYRVKQPTPAKKRMGPALDPDRKCGYCRKPLAWTNQTGCCAVCARQRYMPRTQPSAKRGWFVDGGGI